MDYTGRIRRLEKQRQLCIPELSLSPLIQLCLRDLWCLARIITPLSPPHSLDAWAQALPKLLSLVNVRWYQFVLLQGHLGWRRVKSKQTRHSQCWCLAGDVCVLTPASSTESTRIYTPSICYKYFGGEGERMWWDGPPTLPFWSFMQLQTGRQNKSPVWLHPHCQQARQHTGPGPRKWGAEWFPSEDTLQPRHFQ